MIYKLLTQVNSQYKSEIWAELQALYEGGYSVVEKSNKFIPPLTGEHPARYQERTRAACYLNYIGQIVDFFAAGLFAKGVIVLPPGDAEDTTTPGSTADLEFYNSFARNADRKGNSFTGVLREAFTSAILKKRGAVAVDFPAGEALAMSRADEQFFGEPLPYCYSIPVENIFDWKYGEDGELDWIILHDVKQERLEPEDSRDKKHHEFRIWRRQQGVVYWQLFKSEPYDDDHPIKEDIEIPLVDTGVTTFKRIPIIFIDIPHGLWVGNKAGPGALEHFQRRSTLVSAENRSMVAIPYVALGPEMSAPGDPLPSEAAMDPARGDDPVLKFHRDGFLVLGAGDKVGYAEPEGRAYELVNNQLTELKDELFRVSHQMAASVSNRPSSLSRSGDSKEEDRRVEAIVLGAYADIMRPVAARIYETIAQARGDTVFWTVHGLDNFEKEDRGRLVSEATQLQVIAIPSPTFKKTYMTQLAVKLIAGAPAETVEQVRREIADAVESEVVSSDVPGDMEKNLSEATGGSEGNVKVEVIDYADAIGDGG